MGLREKEREGDLQVYTSHCLNPKMQELIDRVPKAQAGSNMDTTQKKNWKNPSVNVSRTVSFS
jgi:hypothetical protein